MQKIQYLIIALLCAVVQGAWAQTNVGTADELRTAIDGNATNITLTANMTVDKHLTISRAITIDLGGFTLEGNSTALDGNNGSFSCIFIVSSAGNLTLSHGTLANADNSATTNAEHSAGAIVNKGTTTLTGVTIQNCKGYNGGAINNHAGATLTINSVTFTGNTADYCGGAIYNKGTLNFNSGSVSGSTAPYGGAIYNIGSFTMADGTISNCQSTTGGGGGIVNIGTVNISSGTFTNNTAQTDGGAIWNGNSGSAHGTLTMTGGSITGNIANRYGGGIWTESTVNMKGKVIVNNNTVSSSANNVYLNGTNLITCSGAFTDGANIGISLENYNRSFTLGYKTQNGSTAPGTYFHADNNGATLSLDGNEVSLDTQYTSVSNEDELRSAITNGANIKFAADISIGSTLEISGNKTVTINLAGHTLNRGCTSRGSQVIGVRSGSTLYLSNGTVTGGWGGGGGAMFNEGTMHLTNVTISGNTADDRGGGISNNGALTMTGCTVSNNTSLDGTNPAGGGGIFNYNGKTATLTNCTIEKNTASTYAGGGICNYGTMYLNSCTLTENKANTTGGGIFCSTTSTLSINGCTITGNSAVSYGDGIYIDNSTLNMQGLCTVTGNTDSNIYLYGSGTVITVTGAFTSDSNIGLGSSDNIRAYTSGYSTYNSAAPDNYFSFDNGSYAMGLKNGEVYPSIYYVECSWDGGDTDGHVVKTKKVCTDYQEVGGRAELTDHWYFASYSDTYSDRIQVTGDTKLILKDGVTLTCKKGIQIRENSTLTIYAQTGGTGAIKCTGGGGSSSNGHAAIGGNNDETGGHLVIHGGTIEAEPNHNDAAGIGGGDGDSGGQNRNFGMQSITIWDGNVTAKGSSSGAGIGGGKDNSTLPSITIYGGTVNATGGTYSAGIGGGQHISNGVIKIYGGNITATGGNNRWDDSGSGGAGIGGGMSGEMNNDIYIYGGTITANGGEDGAGIGAGGTSSGSAAQNNSLYIYGGTIRAIGGENGAGIGAGKTGNGGPVYIYDGNVEITPGDLGAGIGGGGCYGDTKEAGKGGKVTISGGTVKLTFTNTRNFDRASYIGHGCYIKSGLSVGNLTLGNVKVTLNDAKKAKDNRVSTCQSDISSKSDVLVIEPCDHEDITYKSKNDTHHTVSCSYCSYSADEEHTMVDNKCTICNYGNGVSTLTFYEADSDSYNIETPHTTNNKENFSLPSCSNAPAGKAFIGWMKSGSTPSSVDVGDEETLYSAGQQITVTSDMNGDKYYARYAATVWPGGGNGTENDPFIISETSHWNALVNRVKNNGVDFSGYYLKLGNDVSVTEMVGTSSNRFRGTFDGGGYTLTVNYDTNEQYAAPFRFVGNATIKNLHVSGTIRTSDKYASGLIGDSNGSNGTVTNCRSSVTINSTVSGDGTHGGFVAKITSGTVNIKGCIFDGTMTGSNTNNCGGFVGWTRKAANLTDCLFKPASIGVNTSGCCTFSRRADNATITISNCFYTEALGTAQGTQAYTVTNGQPSDITIDYTKATANYGDDGITAYNYGLLYNGTLYSGDGKSVTFDVSAIAANKGVTAVTATKGTISGSHGSYTLTMVADNSSINATLVDKTNSDVILEDATENTPALEYNDGRTANVIITGRTLYKDGDWNTLCLPTDVTADQIEGAEHPLHGATIKELDTEGHYDANGDLDNTNGAYQTSYDTTSGTLYLYFKTANSITAGKPYLVRWGTPESPTGGTIVNPDFYNSTINSENLEPVRSADGKVQFIGNFDPETLTGGDASNLYLGSDNNLYWPSANKTINAFRGYFHVDLTDETPEPGGSAVRAFVLNFGNDEDTTSLSEKGIVKSEQFTAASDWYTIDGRKLSGKPTKKGLYIYNGKKRVIK